MPSAAFLILSEVEGRTDDTAALSSAAVISHPNFSPDAVGDDVA
jgi:hypothetical protein